MTIGIYFFIANFFNNFKNRISGFFKSFFKEESGMGTIEIIIIMAILIALALIFRTFIMDLANTIFGKIKEKTDAAINTL